MSPMSPGMLTPIALAMLLQSAPRDLFDGTSLAGWVQHGNAHYGVEDGSILGTSGPGVNTFLVSEQAFGDFTFEAEVKTEDFGNSGIQIRSHLRPNGRVFGYQMEIDPAAPEQCAGIYDEQRNGWLWEPRAMRKDAPAIFKHGEWNRYRAECTGTHIKTFLNDQPVADVLDPNDLEGHFGLQVHSGDNTRVRWRKLTIAETGRSAWRPAFDGATLAGWKCTGAGGWRIEQGVLVGTHAASEPKHGVLLSDAEAGDFSLRLKFKATRGNSGLYFHCAPADDAVAAKGMQAEIDPEKDSGGLYETLGRGWVAQAAEGQALVKSGEWNELAVIALGPRVATFLNGKRVLDVAAGGAATGRFGFQLHGGQDVEVAFKDIEILGPAPK